jgi:hypothetical protein
MLNGKDLDELREVAHGFMSFSESFMSIATTGCIHWGFQE